MMGTVKATKHILDGESKTMRLSKLAFLAALCCGANASAAERQHAYYQAAPGAGAAIVQVGHCDCGEVACGCEAIADPACGCEGVCDPGCDSGCGSGLGLASHLSDTINHCSLGEQWSLFGEHCGYSAGGWIQMGYHNKANSLFNSRPDEYQLHQAWLYAEKAIDTSGGFDIGGRIDYLYGTDAPDTQAFGTDPRGWDNSWDNGGDYGHALPQVYVEAGYGDFSVIVGKFFTIIGYEVVPAPDNFFYSHAYTMYNSEPFTHTGVLGTYNYSDDVTIFGGYTFGWDSGFDDNGDSFLGGISLGLTDRWTLTYATTFGRFGEARFNDDAERGYMHSIVSEFALSDKLQYISQSDLLTSEDSAGGTLRETYGINQYLIYTISDCWAVGGRFEWYENEGVYTAPGETAQIYALTLGLNYKPHANLIVRPEIRWDWVDNNAAVIAAGNAVVENGNDQATFGIDTIFLF